MSRSKAQRTGPHHRQRFGGMPSAVLPSLTAVNAVASLVRLLRSMADIAPVDNGWGCGLYVSVRGGVGGDYLRQELLAEEQHPVYCCCRHTTACRRYQCTYRVATTPAQAMCAGLSSAPRSMTGIDRPEKMVLVEVVVHCDRRTTGGEPAAGGRDRPCRPAGGC